MNQELSEKLLSFLNNYEKKLKHENKSINTINSYKNTLNQFISYISFIRDEIKLETLKPSLIYGFFDYKENLLKKQGSLKTGTKKVVTAHLKTFFTFIEVEDDNLLDFSKLFKGLKFKTEKRVPPSLDKNTKQLLLNEIEKKILEKNDYVAFRDSLMLKLMIFAGLRISEVLKLKYKAFVEEDENIYSFLVIGKGNKERITYIEKDLIEDELSELLLIKKPDDFLCTSKNNKIVPRQNVDKILRAFCKRANITPTSAHKLRHTFANNFTNEHGGNIVHLQDLLGHGDIRTTMIYVNPRQEDVKRGFIQAFKLNQSM
ncbi:tyrosine-type recombinase/integrase [Sulfurospirillum multivorans]|uniref:Site-specific recombinase, phage integrase family n=2 Tax=Sulfurospirillum multivorans TaxID=66821 RepID=A0AA86DYB0_SULMK|nr:tyrosine-type recombinase/integrase [Sulfurospirillum multivorans]AHJ13028.1 site-specific recombinase, phage integrase family [Sulfurospirillum multivorans DSM 12446]QEH06519.1 site-specific recombinase, phage integrase family [Sulfurospirillum multivorans]